MVNINFHELSWDKIKRLCMLIYKSSNEYKDDKMVFRLAHAFRKLPFIQPRVNISLQQPQANVF